MKKIFSWFCKAIFAGICALIIATLFCYLYYNVPVHYESDNNSTDYVWTPDNLAIRGTEGFAITKTDKNGFVNTFSSDSESIEILISGSSHTEGFNVSYNKNYTYILNDLLKKENIDMYAYSIGTSGHTFERCLRNLEDAVNEFKPQQYIVIETSSLPDTESMKAVYNNTFPVLSSNSSKIISFLQKNDCLRLLYSQISNFIENNSHEKNTDKNNNENETDFASDNHYGEYSFYLNNLLDSATNLAKSSGCELIIIYNPELKIETTGQAKDFEASEEYNIFKNLCETKDIIFLNMYGPFLHYYNETNKLPRGFINTKIGVGHINEHGHKIIAQTLFEKIKEISDK